MLRVNLQLLVGLRPIICRSTNVYSYMMYFFTHINSKCVNIYIHNILYVIKQSGD